MKNSFAAWVATKGHVVVIALYIHLATSGAAIAEPSAIKRPTTPPWDERAEIFDSGLQCDKLGAEKGVNVFRPRGDAWINGTKLAKDRGPKGGTSYSTTGFEVVAPDKMGADSGHDQRAGNGNDFFRNKVYEFFQGALFSVLFSWPVIFLGNAGPYGGLKHNVAS